MTGATDARGISRTLGRVAGQQAGPGPTLGGLESAASITRTFTGRVEGGEYKISAIGMAAARSADLSGGQSHTQTVAATIARNALSRSTCGCNSTSSAPQISRRYDCASRPKAPWSWTAFLTAEEAEAYFAGQVIRLNQFPLAYAGDLDLQLQLDVVTDAAGQAFEAGLRLSALSGDANADGKIGVADYFAIDRGRALRLTGFANGDFDHSGLVNADDYSVIDREYLARRSGALTLTGGPLGLGAAATAVPEPSVTALGAAATGVLLARRRRTH